MTTARRAVPLSILFLLLVASGVRAEEESPDAVAFLRDLPQAFAAAKEADKPLMICVNSRKVDREKREEPAGKELRENTYKHPRIVELSKNFVCAFITGESTSDDFGELRARYQIDGLIVSPQHIFAYPDGDLIYREEYWTHGTGDQAVDALEAMMKRALDRDRARRSASGEETPSSDAPYVRPAPEDPAERAAWIEEQLGLARGPDESIRREALAALLDADREGDVVERVLALLEQVEDDEGGIPVLVDIVRALGRPGLEKARDAIEDFLKHKEGTLRANAAVSLEYIGSPESASALLRQASREDDEGIANHIYRALGRCGHDSSRVQKTLLKKVQGAKSNFASYGPIIGLAYCEGDKKMRREVEKLLKKEGIPGGRRGGWRGGGKRALLTWCLTEIGDEDSAEFIRKELMPAIPDSQWSERILDFYEAAARVLEGEAEARSIVEGGVQFSLGGWGGGGGRGGGEPRPQLQDDARKGRDLRGFEPKGEFQGG